MRFRGKSARTWKLLPFYVRYVDDIATAVPSDKIDNIFKCLQFIPS